MSSMPGVSTSIETAGTPFSCAGGRACGIVTRSASEGIGCDRERPALTLRVSSGEPPALAVVK